MAAGAVDSCGAGQGRGFANNSTPCIQNGGHGVNVLRPGQLTPPANEGGKWHRMAKKLGKRAEELGNVRGGDGRELRRPISNGFRTACTGLFGTLYFTCDIQTDAAQGVVVHLDRAAQWHRAFGVQTHSLREGFLWASACRGGGVRAQREQHLSAGPRGRSINPPPHN